MKILHVVNTYAPVGGIETYILELLPLLNERGHENALIYRQSHPRTPDTTGQPIYHVPETLDPVRDRQKFTGIIEKERPSLIYLHDVYDPELLLLASQMAPSVGYVHIFYPVCPGLAKLYRRGDEICTRPYGLGCVPMIYLRRCASARHPRSVARIMGQTKQYLHAYKRLSRVMVASRYMRDLMVQNGIPAERVDVLPYFIPTPDKAELAQRPANGAVPRIMFAGRLEYEKGIPYLLQAIRKIKTPHRLLIAGDGSLRPRYIQMATDLGVADRVEFAQWLAPDELQAAYRYSAVTVMPTIMAEPFGKVGVEAMANGRPVVAFNVGGIPDWLIDGHNGFLVPPCDVDQLAARLEQLLVDRALADELGCNGRAYVEEHYSYDKHLDDLMAILQRTVQTGN